MTNYLSNGYYWARIGLLDNTCYAWLFNYQTNNWDKIYISTNERSISYSDDGWDMWEEYNYDESNWPVLGKDFESKELCINIYSVSYNIGTIADNSLNEMGTAPYNRYFDNNYYHWHVKD